MPGWGHGPDLPEGAFVVDPVFGRVVVVPQRILRKIESDHGGYFTPRRDRILDVVGRPDGAAPDPRLERHRYWRRIPGSHHWVFVVVDYARGPVGQVLTAFPRRKLPPGP